MRGAAFFTAATRIPGRSKSAMARPIATTATSQAFAPASSISFGIAAYSIMRAGTPPHPSRR
jgi:hypothetical protein